MDIPSFLILRTGTPLPSCVLNPMLFTLFTHECTSTHSSNTIIKFADDMTIVGLTSGKDEKANRHELDHLTWWYGENNLVLNTSRPKEMIIDLQRTKVEPYAHLHIHGEIVDKVEI